MDPSTSSVQAGDHPPPGAVAFLKRVGADEVPHSEGRSLLHHLIATYRLLFRWNRRRELCLAGLFHSVYGTARNIRPQVPPDRRKDVQDVIGTEAEGLAFHFSTMDQERFLQELGAGRIVSRFDGREIPIDASRERDLCELFVANQLEILGQKRKGSGGMDTAVLIGKCRPFISTEAFEYWLRGLFTAAP